MNEFMKKDYFFCYSKPLADHIRGFNISYITLARDAKSGLLFSLYRCSDELQTALDSYKQKDK